MTIAALVLLALSAAAPLLARPLHRVIADPVVPVAAAAAAGVAHLLR